MNYMMFGIGEAIPHHSPLDWFWVIRYSSVKCHYFLFFTNMTISVLFQHHGFYYDWDVYIAGHSFWTTDLGVLKLIISVSAMSHSNL